MKKIKLMMVTGPGGSRIDFVAGWLGTLSNFVDNTWTISLTTGRSLGYMYQTKAVDWGVDIEPILGNDQLELDGQADTFWAGSCHGYNLNYQKWKDLVEQGKVLFAKITNIDVPKLKWEFVTKTYLTKNRHVYAEKAWRIDSELDIEPSDADRIQAVKDRFKDFAIDGNELPSEFPAINLDYQKLFVPNGSRYLCDQLGISADEVNHRYWNLMLPLADSPEELEVWGHVWRRSDFI